MAYSRRMVERARALRGAGLTVMEITEILGGPGKTSVWRWIRDVRKPAGRAGGGMDLPRLVGDGPDYPDIDPEDKDALIERLRLENAVLRAVQDVLKAESLDGMSNREKTLVIDRLRPAGKWSLRELTGFLRISRSSYDYQRRAIARPDRLAPLRDVVRRVFLEDGDGARGYRFVVRRLRELDDPVRVSEKVVRRTGLATLMWTVPGGAQETGGPYMRDPRHPRHFTDEFKRQIVDLYNAGKPKREIMDEYDLGKSTVERWIKSINATGSPRAADNRTPEQNRILELERENRRLRMEVDVLKQAALIYARK